MSRTIWCTVYNFDEVPYVPRCSYCGKFKRVLKTHWFFTGMYCIACVQDVLWDNARTFEEIEK